MPRSAALAELAVEAQVGIRDLRRRTAPLYAAALRSGDVAVVSEVQAIDSALRSALALARNVAGLAETIGCERDHTFGLFHGIGGKAA